MEHTNELAVRARDDPRALEQLLEEHRSFLLGAASRFCGRRVTPSDDEWAVALEALAEAVRDYRPGRGDFLPFAAGVVRRRLIDHLRAQRKHRPEVPVDPSAFDTPPGEEAQEDLPLRLAVAERVSRPGEDSLRLEILAAGEVFSAYGFSFWDLASCSPKAGKTKAACARAAGFLLKRPILLAELRRTRLLPMKLLEKDAGVPRKILDRHRKYIIAAVEILSGEYPFLAEYLRGVREELDP